MALPAYDTTSGIVRSVNPKGLKLEGHEDWLNFSKFATDLVVPERGAAVTLTLDKSGFIRRVDAADGAEVTMTQNAAPGASSSTHRDRTITRLAVLKAAAEFGAARPNLKSGDVLAIAASWERWINRDCETTYDLTDAF
jgi:hypothetical protein